MVLPVGAPEPPGPSEPVTAPVDEDGREVEVTPLPGRPVQLDERHLDLGMAVDGVAPIRAELSFGGGDRTLGDEEEPIVAERAMPGDRRLDEVAEAVQLVAPCEVVVLRSAGEDLDEGVEVAVRPLGRSDEPDGLVGHRADPVVRFATQLPAGRLEPLVDVGVEERERRAEHQTERPIPMPAIAAPAASRKLCEVPALRAARSRGDRSLAVRRQPVGPEPAGDADIRAGERPDGRGRADRMAGRP